jgi:negative regulator of replication initiation
MQTERTTILTTAAEKAQLFSRAKTLGVSSSEVVRRALRRDEEASDEEEFAALVAEANAAIPKIAASIERMTKRLEEMNRKDDEFLKKMGMAG